MTEHLSSVLLLCTLLCAHSLWLDPSGIESGSIGYTTSLKDWIKDGDFNLALVPQFNNEYTIFGMTEALREAGLQNLKGVSTVSGTSLPGAFLAAGLPFAQFNRTFPANGWGGFGPQEPKMENDYRTFLRANMPQDFSKLQIPLAISVAHWKNTKDLKALDKKKAKLLVLNEGDLHGAMVAAVASGTNSHFSDSMCPFCLFGFHPKSLTHPNTGASLFPVTDGGLLDPWGMAGLFKLPKRDRVLHILSLDYDGQWKPRAPHELPNYPKEVVSLIATQPPVATQSAMLENFGQKIITRHSASEWNEMMFTNSYKAMKTVLNQPLEMQRSGMALHGILKADSGLAKMETYTEKMFDGWSSGSRDLFWKWARGQSSAPQNKRQQVEAMTKAMTRK